jgi:hypothetical protein
MFFSLYLLSQNWARPTTESLPNYYYYVGNARTHHTLQPNPTFGARTVPWIWTPFQASTGRSTFSEPARSENLGCWAAAPLASSAASSNCRAPCHGPSTPQWLFAAGLGRSTRRTLSKLFSQLVCRREGGDHEFTALKLLIHCDVTCETQAASRGGVRRGYAAGAVKGWESRERGSWARGCGGGGGGGTHARAEKKRARRAHFGRTGASPDRHGAESALRLVRASVIGASLLTRRTGSFCGQGGTCCGPAERCSDALSERWWSAALRMRSWELTRRKHNKSQSIYVFPDSPCQIIL